MPHLTDSIPEAAKGYRVSMYSVALEGWRRGLRLKFINGYKGVRRLHFSLSDGKVEKIFRGSRGEGVTNKASRICRNKHKAKQLLTKAGVPTPEGELFGKNSTDEEIISYGNSLGYPNVIKPVDGAGGSGVISNIKNEEEFKASLKIVREELNYSDIIVEKHFDGRGYRVYVIGDKVAGAFDRIPANVVGDGVNNIKTLLKEKLKERDKNPALFKRPIPIDSEMHNVLSEQNYTIDSIPKKGERVFLKTKNNVSSGGDSIDVTDLLTEEIKKIAVDAVRAIPGLAQCGVDLIVDEDKNTAVVLELNSLPSLRNHLFPNEGKARNIPKDILDYYFPETADVNYFNKPLYYFDVKHVFTQFRKGVCQEIVIPDYPSGELVSKKFKVYGVVQHVKLGSWVRRKARVLNLNGYIKHLKDGSSSIVVSGNLNNINKFKQLLSTDVPKNVIIDKLIEQKRIKPVKIGFEIVNVKKDKPLKDGYHPVRLQNIKSRLNNKNNSNPKQIDDYYKKQYEKVVSSTSWRVTKPLRALKRIFK